MLVTVETYHNVLDALDKSTIVVADTETNGLEPFNGSRMIGLALYFPELAESYYLPFRHGVGEIEVGNLEGATWATKAKKADNLRWYWQQFKPDYGNLPLEYIKPIADRWVSKRVIMYNALFDLAVLHVDGFPMPDSIEDAMIGVSLIEDWGSIKVEAPFTWTKTDRDKAKCATSQIGKWARDENGVLLKKQQFGNKRLKWICAMLGFERATYGEEELQAECEAFSQRLCDTVPNPPKEHPHKYVNVDEKSQMWMLSPKQVFTYALNDVHLTWELRTWVIGVLAAWDNVTLYNDLQKTLVVAWNMERDGVLLDAKVAAEQIAILSPKIEELEAIFSPVNVGSWQQLLPFLNANLGQEWADRMPSWMTPDEKAGLQLYPDKVLEGTDVDELEKVEGHALVRMVKSYRQLKKTATTYLAKWIASADETNHVHPHFETTGTVTGRWSSSGSFGNAQNIPDRGGYTIKRSLLPNEGNIMFALDYGQLELRLATWVAENILEHGDHEMTKLFTSGEDMHSYVRDRINVRNIVFGNMSNGDILTRLGYNSDDNPEKIAKECRQIAKTMNFGLLYGGTGAMLSRLLKIDRDKADVLCTEWNELFPAFRSTNAYYERLALTPRKRPDNKRIAMYVTQPFSGRHRKYDKLPTWALYKDDDGVTRSYNPQQAEARKAFNFIIQGLGGYIATMSAAAIEGVMFNFQIHDALDGQLPVTGLDKIYEVMYAMTNWDVTPNLTVDLQAGWNWQDMRQVKNVDLWVSSQGREGY